MKGAIDRSRLENAAASIYSVRCSLDNKGGHEGNVRQLDEALEDMASQGIIIPQFIDEQTPGRRAKKKR